MFVPRRLNKYLRQSTGLSARGVERLWAEGTVRVERPGALPTRALGDAAFEGLESLVFEDDVVTVGGCAVAPRDAHETLMLNKPRAVTSTVRDPDGKRDLSGYMADMPEGAFPIGRLDRETTGLLLFTTDGDLCNALLRPDHHADKVYSLWVDGCISESDPRLAAMTEGIKLSVRRARAKQVVLHHRTSDATELLVTLNEGQNRQIRRMCYALGFRLLHLHRRRVGSVTLGTLAQGQWATLTPPEVEALWRSAGGRASVVERQTEALRRRTTTLRRQGRPDARLERWLDGASRGHLLRG